MNLNDLLVSYKQVKTPDLIPNIVFDNTPTLSYQEANDTPQKKLKKDTKTRGNNVQYFVPVGVSDRTIKSRKPSQSSEGWKSPYTKRDKWTSDMIASYRKAGLTNDNAIKMLVAQDALESRWGRSAQGRFNFGNLTAGAKWDGDYVRGNDHDAKGNPIKQKFRSYNSMDEYAVDKLQFLKHLYDFDENDDINTFTAKLTGKNKGKRRYAEATDYADRVAAVFKSFKNGGVIKAQAGTIVADNTRVVKPTIQEKIQRTYPEQPQFVQDNRSDWQRQQSQKRAKTDYNQYMEDKNTEKGLRNLNGFLNFTDYATMGLGAGSLLFKGAKWAGKRAVGQVSRNAAKDQLQKVKIGDLLSSGKSLPNRNLELPQYAVPNSPMNPIDLHSDRLIKGGFDRIPGMVGNKKFHQTGAFFWPYKAKSQFYNINYYDRMPQETVDKIVEDFATAVRNVDVPVKEWYQFATEQATKHGAFATAGTGNVYIGKDGLRKIIDDYGVRNIDRTISHEIDHALHIPAESSQGFNLEYLRKSTPSQPNYFIGNNNSELAARGTQIKDYFGLNSPDQEITEDMLRYAAQNYVRDTGMNNNMIDFFNSITDWKEAAKWLSKYATMAGVPITVNKTNK